MVGLTESSLPDRTRPTCVALAQVNLMGWMLPVGCLTTTRYRLTRFVSAVLSVDACRISQAGDETTTSTRRLRISRSLSQVGINVPRIDHHAGATVSETTVASKELALLLRITNRLNSSWQLDEILDTLYEDLHNLMPFDRMEYAVLDDRGYVLTTLWVRTEHDSTNLPVGYEYRRSVPIDRERFVTAFIDNDLAEYAEECASDHPVSLLVTEGLRSSLNCPLIVADEVKGCLFFNSRLPGSYTEHHLSLIQPIAGHLAAVVEQSRLNEQLRVQNEALRALERSRLEFVASISHELRTPLTGVVGFASELRDRLEDFTNEEIKQFATLIAQQGSEVSGIVEDLLVITRAEAGHLAIYADQVSIKEQVLEVLGSFQSERTDQLVESEMWDGDAAADPRRVRQIVRNLLSNAARYGGPNVRVTVVAGEQHMEVTVADDGGGIPEQDREAVFKAYGRARAARPRTGSIGLGLTVSRYLAEAMGGTLTYAYEGGESLFVLQLPKLDIAD